MKNSFAHQKVRKMQLSIYVISIAVLKLLLKTIIEVLKVRLYKVF